MCGVPGGHPQNGLGGRQLPCLHSGDEGGAALHGLGGLGSETVAGDRVGLGVVQPEVQGPVLAREPGPVGRYGRECRCNAERAVVWG